MKPKWFVIIGCVLAVGGICWLVWRSTPRTDHRHDAFEDIQHYATQAKHTHEQAVEANRNSLDRQPAP